MTRVLRFGRWAGVITLALGYAILAHYTNATPQTENLGLGVALAPILVAVALVAWNAAHRLLMLTLLVAAAIALWALWSRMAHHYSLVYWMEHAGTQLMLCAVFARTLLAGREPMCTGFARMVHGTLAPVVARYTRQVTVAWALFFGGMASVSTLLYAAAPLETWSIFANFFTAPLIVLMFVLEYAARRMLLPDIEHAHILDGVKAYWKQPAR